MGKDCHCGARRGSNKQPVPTGECHWGQYAEPRASAKSGEFGNQAPGLNLLLRQSAFVFTRLNFPCLCFSLAFALSVQGVDAYRLVEE
jgi:hypothetical protein